MKKIPEVLKISTVFSLLIGSLCLIKAFAQDIDIDVNEPQATITKWRITDIIFHGMTKEAIVTLRKGYFDGPDFIYTKNVFTVLFIDRADDPATPEDETLTDYTDFVTFIGVVPSKVKTAVKLKLGI